MLAAVTDGLSAWLARVVPADAAASIPNPPKRLDHFWTADPIRSVNRFKAAHTEEPTDPSL